MHFKIGFENDLIPIYTYLLLCRRRHRRRPVFFIKIKKKSYGVFNTRTYTDTELYF